VAALLEPALGTVTAIKAINFPFVVGTAFGIGSIVSSIKGHIAGQTATAVGFVIPTLVINAFAWGQADAIYGCFLVWFVSFAIRGEMTFAALMFGVSFSFKAQAIFVAPLLLYFLLAGQMRIRHFLIIAGTYLAMMTPAALAGRTWVELLTIYYRQAEYMPGLSFNTPSPWIFAQLTSLSYSAGLIVGLILAAAGALLIGFGSLRLPERPENVLLIACLSAIAMPYLLPNMTARYFFVADLLTVALAFVIVPLWPAAVLVQVGSLLAYLAYFSGVGTAQFGFFPMTFALLLLTAEFYRRHFGRVAQIA
jgi:Gpi18-like mannosyltransferase